MKSKGNSAKKDEYLSTLSFDFTAQSARACGSAHIVPMLFREDEGCKNKTAFLARKAVYIFNFC
jgi:hypothetical protein